ncbi:MAG: GNAT family N-acetyltransferase [Bryobacteraceae bacterium]
MPLSLRPVLPQDAAFVHQLVYETMYEQLFAWTWNPAVREPLLKIQIEGQRTSYAVQFPQADHGIILLDERPVGRLIVERGPEMHYLVDISILKAQRGRGIGTWILRALCTEADLMQKPLRLQVQIANRAKDLYLRLGFHMIEDRQVAWLMERVRAA